MSLPVRRTHARRTSGVAPFSYSHELMSTPPSLVEVGGGSFTVDGIAPSRDRLALGGGVTAQMSDRLALYADYHVTLPTGNLVEHTLEAGLTLTF
jgi:outer membrane autotransporter protein